MAHIILHIATSRDGFIADKTGGVDWLPTTLEDGQDCGFNDFLHSVEGIALGSKTYEQILGFIKSGIIPDWPHSDKITYVFTRNPIGSDHQGIVFVSGIEQFLQLVHANKSISRIWLMGGAKLIKSFQEHGLIDEMFITIIPVDIYEGIALPAIDLNSMEKAESIEFKPHGIIQDHYIPKN